LFLSLSDDFYRFLWGWGLTSDTIRCPLFCTDEWQISARKRLPFIEGPDAQRQDGASRKTTLHVAGFQVAYLGRMGTD